jgi:glycosyltransferase involved in cell wall biosynthesis
VLKELEDPYPYFRGILSEIGFKSKEIPYVQPVRKYGISKNNFYTLYDIAMLGITEHSKVPLRVCTVLGFFSSLICIFAAFIFFILKIIFWNFFSIGIIPIIISIFFLGSIQLFCIGLLGEYIGFIHTKLKKRPLVIEEDRINF